jgi:hypothetical protein
MTQHADTLGQKFQTVGPPPLGGRSCSSGVARIDCMRNMLILNEICLQGKIYILLGTLLG